MGWIKIAAGFCAIILISWGLSHTYDWTQCASWSIFNSLAVSFSAIMLLMSMGWLVSLYRQRVDHVDILWGLGFLIAPLPALLCHAHHLQLLTYLVLLIWSFRLQLQIHAKQHPTQEDKRYQGFRKTFGSTDYWWFSFYQVYVLQGVLLCFVALPVQVIMLQPELNSWILAPLIISTIGIIYEGIADYQLYQFKKKQPNKIFTGGLFAYSRHPNYFGEIIVWLGFTLAALSQTTLISEIICALFGFFLITYLLVKVSGVSMTQAIMIERPGYGEYASKVPALLPSILKRFKSKDFR